MGAGTLFEMLVEGMKQAQGITEQLKAENQLEWVKRLNNIRAWRFCGCRSITLKAAGKLKKIHALMYNTKKTDRKIGVVRPDEGRVI